MDVTGTEDMPMCFEIELTTDTLDHASTLHSLCVSMLHEEGFTVVDATVRPTSETRSREVIVAIIVSHAAALAPSLLLEKIEVALRRCRRRIGMFFMSTITQSRKAH